jgi:hypothetical protein
MKQEQARAHKTPHARRWITPKQAAKHYKFGISTMAKWRLNGEGPAFFKLGAKVLYDEDEFDAWLESKRVTSTSQGRP